MFWNRKDEPFIDERDFNYPKVLIKTPHKDIEGYIKEVDFDYLDERSKVFIVHAEREHPITRERIGTLFGVSIKEVEANDWYMKITHDGQTLYETVTKNTKPNLLEIKLKDTDSVPEVYYKGEKLERLIDVSYHYHTTTEVVAGSTNDINMEYLGEVTMYPDIKTIGHKRDV
ncbi:hypothetical protein HQ957_05855 [Enterococcus faecium]|nr:hypothetical protein [Enterococcus faecium]NTR68659.1 hypothetical protein [Enterococcus faecium]NTS03704.1 hypothetical protein [Enterococcus faecium]TQA82997.1 hypothetical protein FKY82_05495 [Enterococcus faecium]TQB06110.1 hypothetical protein FKY88_04915 [Enterococcus faecium]TQB17912.1 hypothetical protein FKZ06_11570 [Enterococcus faecium]